MVAGDFRVTQQTLANRVTTNMQQTLARLQQLQSQISSNKRIEKPSDDPVGTVSALRLRNDIDRSDQIGRNISDALGWLGTADDSLNAVVEQVQRVRDLAVQAQNGAMSQTELDGIAAEMDKIRDTLIGLANTKYGERSIFAGTANGPAYDNSGNYLGQTAAVDRTIAPGVRIAVNVTGDDVFGGAGADLFTMVANLATAVRSGSSAAIGTQLTNIDNQTHTVQSRLAEVGARTRRVETMQSRNESGVVTLKQGLSSVEDLDLPKAIMEMQMQSVAYQAALSTTAKVIQPSLVDFLR